MPHTAQHTYRCCRIIDPDDTNGTVTLPVRIANRKIKHRASAPPYKPCRTERIRDSCPRLPPLQLSAYTTFSSSNYGVGSSASQSPLATPPEWIGSSYGKVSPKDIDPYPLDGPASWANFPSHLHEERNGSAGWRDGVASKDFAPTAHEPSRQGTAQEPVFLDDGTRSERFKRRLAASLSELKGTHDPESNSTHPHLRKTRSVLLRKRIKTGFLALFKTPDHETGHRTSIAVGGKLEHPELEMLPVHHTGHPMFSVIDVPGVDSGFCNTGFPSGSVSSDVMPQTATPHDVAAIWGNERADLLEEDFGYHSQKFRAASNASSLVDPLAMDPPNTGRQRDDGEEDVYA